MSVWFDVQSGVRQGCVIAPLLFNIYIDFVVKQALARMPEGCGVELAYHCDGQLHRVKYGVASCMELVSVLMYADDMVLLSKDAEELAVMLQTMDKVSAGLGMRMNASKTEIMPLAAANAQQVAAPARLFEELFLAQRVLRDIAHEKTRKILIDSRENFTRLSEFATDFTPSMRERVTHYAGERPLFEMYGIDEEIQKALARRVELKSGGYLIFDQTEAMNTIDVNTGGYIGTRSFDDTIFKTNLEAAQTIARQLRLRNLGGIIIVDFIDMESAEHRNAVLAELSKAVSRDRIRVTVNGFTSLGLVELTRKRTRESLAHQLCEPCPTCAKRGEVKTARTVCYEVLREILREAKQFNPKEFRIVASQNVVDLFLDEEAQNLAALGDFIGKKISLSVESQWPQEQYDIVLM